MKKWIVALAGLGLATVAGAELPAELAAEARAAMARGAEWLAGQQQAEGYWALPDFPAMTGLSTWALQRTDPAGHRETIERGTEFILASVREDGSIWREPSTQRRGGGLANYNTAICMTALHSLGRPELVATIQRARTFLARMQHHGDDVFRGGKGYDATTDRAYADLSNSYIAYEAMRLTQDVEDLRAAGDPRADLDWGAVQEFLAQLQNLSAVNTNAWVSESDADRGGFAYSPGAGAASSTNAEGRVTLRSYGSMTYAGLLSLIYAEVDERDVRVQSARDWASRHWTLDENPGMDQQGLYYFFNVLSKSLRAMGDERIERADGTSISWREEVVRRVLSLQRPDGFWVNENNRWWEADPNLVTAYTLLTLATALE